MAEFGLEIVVTNRRRARCTATWPETVPEIVGATKGAPYDLSTALKIWFMAKPSKGADDSQAIFSKATDLAGVNDITFGLGGDSNKAYFDVVEADTAAFANITRTFEAYGELKVKAATGEVWTVAQGSILLRPTNVKAIV